MFRAVNTESESERRRIAAERQNIQANYLSATKTLNLDKFLDMKVMFEQNQEIYKIAKANLLFTFVRRTPLENVEGLINKYHVLESKPAYFELVRKYIKCENFIRAKKLLNLARSNGWICNDLFDLEKEITKKYFNDAVSFKKPKLDDLIK